MKKLRLIIAIIACKAAIVAGNLLGKEASSAPGALALKICPDILKILSSQVKGDIVAVCGTNGKTTTNNLLYSFLTENGYKVVSNNYGANMLPGVCCAFAKSATIFGKINADFACLEIDEASTVRVFEKMTPDKMIITNLFRDQLDRYGEISQTAALLKKALSHAPKTELILNADDPYVSHFGTEAGRKCYYISAIENTSSNAESDKNVLCPLCGEKLSYDYHHYSQLGKYHCPSCSFKRADADFKICDVSVSDNLIFTLNYGDKNYSFDVGYKGFYNIYNISTAFSVALLLIGNVSNYEKILSSYKPQIGRMEEFNIGKKLILNMSKNPAGFNQGIAAIMADNRTKDIAIAVNDAPSDGTDISWLWDVKFENLLSCNIGKIYVSGSRADDVMVRLKYSGFETERFSKADSLKDSCHKLRKGTGEALYYLSNYTATFALHDILKNMEKETKHEL